MKHRVFSPWPGVLHTLALTVFTLADVAHAQLVPDGGTATLANVTTNITGGVTVGTNGAFTRLTLSDCLAAVFVDTFVVPCSRDKGFDEGCDNSEPGT